MNRKKAILFISGCVLLLCIAFMFWSSFASSTRIAFVNYQAILLGQISKANDNPFIKISELPVDALDEAGNYDMVFVNGMGLRITDEQRQNLIKVAENGIPVLTTAATNPQNFIVSVDSVDSEFLRQYLAGGRNNYRNMLRYVRKFIDGKLLFTDEPEDPEISATSLLYYPSDKEDLDFASVAEYEGFLKTRGKWKAEAPRIILTGQMGVADSLVARLEQSGSMVYPVNEIRQFVSKGHADSIHASAMINMAHGRMGDMVVRYLEKQNIPLFSPLNVNRDYEEWMADKMGMNGGFLSQSVVTPEIDGAVLPYAIFAHYKGKDGLPYVAAIPDRLGEFVETVNNYISLQRKKNQDKKIAIFYFKGPGQHSLVAEGMEVAPSLYNLLSRMKSEGYNVELPASQEEFERMINENGKVFNRYAVGAQEDFIKNHSTRIVSVEDYDRWCGMAFSKKMREDIDAVDGKFPGHGLNDGAGNLALAGICLGNVVLIPQTAAGHGADDFKIVHGTDAAPPHNYVAAYLWARFGFKADALMHFGAHGSLEFTPRKQVALGSDDWSDRLVGTVPHFYVYSTSNVGEAMVAKRRSYASIVNYLTPPFMESNARGIYKNLSDAIAGYNKAVTKSDIIRAARLVKKYTVGLGIHRELRLDSIMSRIYSADDILRIENFADELANEKITGALYVMGMPYSSAHIVSTVKAMTVDPIAYSMYKLKGGTGKIAPYRAKAVSVVTRLMDVDKVDDDMICRIAGITHAELDSARNIIRQTEGSKDMLSRMMVMGSMMTPSSQTASKISDRPKTSGRHGMMPGMSEEKALEVARMMGASEENIERMKAAMKKKCVVSGSSSRPVHGMGREEMSSQEMDFAIAVSEVERAIRNVSVYAGALRNSPEMELLSILNGLNGGYISPASGGDPVLNPGILPTGRNMFAVNAEETPSAVAWEKGKSLAESTIAMYRKNHGDSIPRKVSYTLWSSEFIETAGATIAQVLYMLGVEPVRDPFGRVADLRLIPSEELGRPRIDVVVQTSGQLRDLAASRLFLISRAVRMAAEADDKGYPNYVAEGVVESERHLVEKGVTPKEARELSTARVFGGVNGNYGSGIQNMVEAGDRWEDNSEIASVYIKNMGAIYCSEEEWEKMRDYAFEAALTRTDVVVQPRQSNTWGALSLDHVYEFMGGMNLAVRTVTGREPEAYLSDYRNRNNVKMQEVKEAIGIESRTTILNPTYIKEKMKGGAGDASGFAEVITNTYAWNVMKPDVIDNELWNDIYDTYIADRHNLGTKKYFKSVNPAAVQEITAVMLETVRKGMWKASPEQIQNLADLHAEVIEEYGAACSGFVCDNAKLRDFISSHLDNDKARHYNSSVASVRAENIVGDNDAMVMEKETLNADNSTAAKVSGTVIVLTTLVVLLIIFIIVSRRKRNQDRD
ncbi:cobaltochelatase subunit CobN [Xylanibacter muris]|uniref:Cobaltochelatase subunit CobN n=1 Tax=Xylanibacter muris TaxID=2736290 RepID=A0ABX2ALY9_9BACT|nr:cobaltochelatase subunit CobN [Xylanibacter muris]NPD90956.1 cobaltochelatase subunit CobN [Xylanibacter muris]